MALICISLKTNAVEDFHVFIGHFDIPLGGDGNNLCLPLVRSG